MKKNVAPFVLGLIGGIIGLVSGLCWAVCAEFGDAINQAAGQSSNYALFAWVFGVGSGIIGIVGSAMSLSEGKKGGIVMIVGAIFSVAAMVTVEFSTYYIITAVTLAIAGLLGLMSPKAE